MSNEEPQGSLFFAGAGLRMTEGVDRLESRVAVFVDGSNLHHRLVNRGWPANVDIARFAQRLAGERRLVAAYYYNVPPPRTHKPEQIASQRRYYARIEAAGDVVFRLGHLQERRVAGRTAFEEKGVDVSLTVDMLTGAFEDHWDTAILVSSDGDFAPAVNEVRRRGKRVEYIFFPSSAKARALQQACSVSRKCRLSWVVQFDS